jgi:hypothetical protein
MVRNNDVFSWDLRLAGSVLVGSYHHTINGNFAGRGHAEWRFGSATGLEGTYAASFFDTSTTNTTEDRASQIAVITITSVNSDGVIAGTGSVRLAGEQSRRQFGVSGTVDSGAIELVWSGADLFGSTVWHLRKSGNFLFGTYTNLASNNQTVEFQGHATFVRGTTQ